MANWFDRYGGPDLWVGVASETQKVFEDKLGFPANQPRRMTGWGTGCDIAFLAVNEDMSMSASYIQLMSQYPSAPGEPLDEDGWTVRNTILAYVTSQRMDRPTVAHVQAISPPSPDDIPEIRERLDKHSVPYVPRIGNLYVGVATDDSGRFYYDKEADAGLYLEFGGGDHRVARTKYPNILMSNASADTREPATDLEEGTLVSVSGRVQLVASINKVLDRMRTVLDWPEEGSLEFRDGDGYKSCVMKPLNPFSAVWELIEPTSEESEAGRVMARYGEGPWRNRLGVYGLEEWLEQVGKRGVGWDWIDDGPSGHRARLNRWDLRGASFEVEDLPVVYRGSGTTR